MAAWRRLPSLARGGLIAAVSAVFGAAVAILVSASGLVDSQISPVAAPSTVTVTAAPDAAGLEPVPPAVPALRSQFEDSPKEGFIVGVDVRDGRYVSEAPQSGEVCTWSRLRKDSGQVPVQRSSGRRERGESAMSVIPGDLLFTGGCKWVRQS